ncbi:MAG: hypothetical protein IKQ41_12630 [Clostridia bacterium]|nr:hypothetical protein [Clostridia bacterium]
MLGLLGLPVEEALSSLPDGSPRPEILEISAPLRDGEKRASGTLRLLSCREGVWIAARFLDQDPPAQKEET